MRVLGLKPTTWLAPWIGSGAMSLILAVAWGRPFVWNLLFGGLIGTMALLCCALVADIIELRRLDEQE